jgi:hypothetical protein
MCLKKYIVTVIMVASVLGMPAVSHGVKKSEQELGSLTGNWWQWAYSIPNTRSAPDNPPREGKKGSIHPLVGDNSDIGDLNFFEYCGNGQHGDVWFLGGDFSGTGEPFERTCEIPSGKTILVAIINFACSTAEGDATKGATVEQQTNELQACTEPVGDLLSGTAIFGPEGGPLVDQPVLRLVTQEAFSVYFSPNNVVGLDPVDPNPSLADADGQWVVLEGLESGRYRLEFNGTFDDPETPESPDFELNGAYNIEVAQPNGEPPAGP